jgi:malate dehydrogenase (oxaloacetate-decarboxylating)(NADP+)
VLIVESIARPILIGRPTVIEQRFERLGLPLRAGDIEIINPEDDPRYRDYVALYHSLQERNGVTLDGARAIVRTNTTAIGALAVRRGEADALLCGLEGDFPRHAQEVQSILGLADGVSHLSTLSVLIMPRGTFFLADTYVNADPDADELVKITLQARDHMSRFAIKAKVALLSHSAFGSRDAASAAKMREVYRKLKTIAPDLLVEGEMPGDLAVNETLRKDYISNPAFSGEANLLIFPNLEAANLSLTLLAEINNGLPIGPILMGTGKAAHVLAPTVTSRGIINMAAIAAAEAVKG